MTTEPVTPPVSGGPIFRASIARLLAVNAMIGVGCLAVLLLPSSPKMQPLGLKLELPEFIGEWYGQPIDPSEKEIRTLGRGTDFCRRVYTNGRGDEVMASIVLSGQDMNVSIHRPERCLPAQGWTIVDSRPGAIRFDARGDTLPMTRLHNVRAVQTTDGKTVKVFSLNYYWFTGYDVVSASHLERNWFDIRDRVLRGYNQRWAYVTVTSRITNPPDRFGRNERETDALLQEFIRQMIPKIHLDTVKYRR